MDSYIALVEVVSIENEHSTQTVSDNTIGNRGADVDLRIIFVVTDSIGTLEGAVHLQTVNEC